jgi:CheY-like chemotaxis protein
LQDSNRGSVEQILKAGERAAALTRQLLAFSRRQRLQPKIVDLNQLVTSAGLMLRRVIGEDVDLRLALGPDLGRVNVDPGQIEQVIVNLAINARDAMPRGGTLTVETSNVELDDAYAGKQLSLQAGSYVLLAVSDTGIGMSPETRNRVFEPFFTTKGPGKGTGLGMSTVFGIVKQSRGGIQVYSEIGKGTTVKVYLPRIHEVAPVEAEHVQTHATRGTETILLVEDEDMVRKLVRVTLEREGYTLLDAGGPDEAQRICENHQGFIHLMITDVVMPRSSGRELADRVALLRPEMKVLYMSGYTGNAILNSGVLDKAANFLQKPFSPQMLARKVREVLEGSDQGKTRLAGG